MSTPTPNLCSSLSHPHWFPTTLASFLILGIVLSYFPQHHKILSRKSSEGLSPWWVLLGGLSSISAMGNILTLPISRASLACCREISGRACAAAFLGVVQIGCQWLCFMIIVLLYVTFYDYKRAGAAEEEEVEGEERAGETGDGEGKKKEYEPVIVGGVNLGAVLVVGVVSAVLVYGFPSRTQGWANLLGVLGGVMATVQYVPQIYTTWRLKGARSLSILTMSVQVPGALVFAFSLWMRVGWQGWSTWIIFLITASLQSVVLVLAVVYSVRAKEGREVDERTALLGGDGTDVRTTTTR